MIPTDADMAGQPLARATRSAHVWYSLWMKTMEVLPANGAAVEGSWKFDQAVFGNKSPIEEE